MFQISNFSFAHPGENPLLTNCNLSLNPQERVVLLGSNGVGKSSILRGIWESSFDPSSSVKLSTAKVYVTQDIPSNLSLNPQKPAESIYEILFQLENNLESAINDEFLMDWLSEAILHLPKDFQRRLDMNLFEMRLSPGSLSNRYDQLSPGTKKKLLLSILFASEPEVILADELTNHLDYQAITILLSWIQKSRAAILLVDHNQEFVSVVSRNFLFLPNNQERKIIQMPGMSYVQALEYLDNLEKRQRDQLAQAERKLEQLEAAREEFRYQARVFNSTKSGKKIKAIEHRIEREITQNPIMTELDLKKRVIFDTKINKQKVKDNLLIKVGSLEFLIGSDQIQTVKQFKLYQGQRIRITGENGRGKSTLLGLTTESMLRKDLSQNAQYVSGTIEHFNLEYSEVFVLKQVTNYPTEYSVMSYLQEFTDMMPFEVDGLLKRLELEKFHKDSFIGHFSMGEFIRLQMGVLARIQHSIKLLLLDEPGNFLDIFTQRALIKMLETYSGALLLVTHDQVLADAIELDGELALP